LLTEGSCRAGKQRRGRWRRVRRRCTGRARGPAAAGRLRVPGFRRSTRSDPVEVLRGVRKGWNSPAARKLGLRIESPMVGLAQIEPLERRWSELAGPGSFLTSGRRCRGGSQRLGCGGAVWPRRRNARARRSGTGQRRWGSGWRPWWCGAHGRVMGWFKGSRAGIAACGRGRGSPEISLVVSGVGGADRANARVRDPGVGREGSGREELREAGRWVSQGRVVHRAGVAAGLHGGADEAELRGEEGEGGDGADRRARAAARGEG